MESLCFKLASYHLNTNNSRQLTITPYVKCFQNEEKGKVRSGGMERREGKRDKDRRKDGMDAELENNRCRSESCCHHFHAFDGKQISFFEAAFPIMECLSYKMATELNEII